MLHTIIRYLPRFQRAYRELKHLESRESWSRGEVEQFQLERINALWRRAITSVPYYEQLARERELPERFESLEEYQAAVPVLPRETVRQRPRDFLARARPQGTWKRTSGSTGNPLSVYWGYDAHQEMLRCKYRFLAMWGVDIFDRTVYLWGQGNAYEQGWKACWGRWRQPVEDWLRRRLRLSTLRLRKEDLLGHLERMAAFRPALLYSYSKAGYLLAREARQAGVRLPSLKLTILSSERVYPEYVGEMEAALGVPTVVEYGSIECGLLACEDTTRHLRVREDVAFMETVPQAGGCHRIIVTVLNNPAFPLFRYEIGDLTSAPLRRPPVGFAVLADVVGRCNSLLQTPTGNCIHPAQVELFFEAGPRSSVRRYDVHQRQDGSVEVLLELTQPVGAGEIAGWQHTLEEMVGGYPVCVKVVDEIPMSASGKHRWIRSDLLSDTARRAEEKVLS
jgi:phenylacetate-CoA ligase